MDITTKRLLVKVRNSGRNIKSKLKNLPKTKLSRTSIDDFDKSNSLGDMISITNRMDPTTRRVLNTLYFSALDMKGVENKGDSKIFDLVVRNKGLSKEKGFEAESHNITSINDLEKYVNAVSKMRNVGGFEKEYINKFKQNQTTSQLNERYERAKEIHKLQSR